MTVYVYDDSTPTFWRDLLTTVDATSPYALTGAVFSRDRAALLTASDVLRQYAPMPCATQTFLVFC